MTTQGGCPISPQAMGLVGGVPQYPPKFQLKCWIILSTISILILNPCAIKFGLSDF